MIVARPVITLLLAKTLGEREPLVMEVLVLMACVACKLTSSPF